MVAPQEPASIILYSLHSSTDDKREIEVIESLSRSHPGPVIVLADGLELPQLKSVMQAGASGYLLHDVSIDALHCAMNLVMAGEKVLPSALVDILMRDNKLTARGAFRYSGASLTDAEKRIMRCLAAGNSNKEIARNCDITEGTVKVHLKTIFRRIGVANRTQAALWALDHIDLEPKALTPALSAGSTTADAHPPI
jgi:two-component system nitrate/nitrite response regulator NarL